MAINGVQNNTAGYYENISSGNRINRAADDAAGLSISEQMTGQINGYNKGTENAEAGRDLLKIADGALGSITDSLQRIRELSLQATNMTYSQDERDMIQNEINQIKESIQGVAEGTEYNTKKLLDGSMADDQLVTHPQGGGLSIQMDSSTLETLGIADYDVSSGKFDISVIDNALSMVMESRESIGSASNALDHTIANNNYTAENLTAARSQIKDADIAESISELKKNQVIEEYRMFSQKEQQNREEDFIKRMLL